MNKRFDVYFAGQILDGKDPDNVRANLAKLFKADDSTLDLLFSGKAYLVKRECDRDTALKYKKAMERAGAGWGGRSCGNGASVGAMLWAILMRNRTHPIKLRMIGELFYDKSII